MHFIYFLTACILTSAAGVASADSPAPRQCSFYTGANTNSATCNEIPNLTCMQGCGWNFVVAEGCQPTDGTWAPPSTQVCDVGFGRDTAAAKACITSSGSFSCRGATSGYTWCYGCVPNTVTYNPGSSDNYPPEWAGQSPIPVQAPSS
ncbi:hypothetical protein PCANC_11377 [Puccinia coronata f. sp. avenae]|uniref:CBM1 domain-containing protein n=1 Tax=Puccinia coronata f. sp. avenae TaxID=200324 RepID=A0A2N5SUU4_9BASI|nr:hypothetical protein PCANC_11377 [Puccinia coronata f. sp. avenae]PLW22617.1 hypothetical protein PCASD_12220 [Puccinia coronata f. sp. avenae]